jgi:hypothetical protein
MLRGTIVLLMVVVAMTSPTGSVAADRQNAFDIPTIRVDDRVRVRTVETDARWIEGRVTGIDDRTLSLETSGRLHTIDRSHLADLQLERRVGRHWRLGAGIGAVTVGGGSLALGVALAEDNWFDVDGSDVIALTVVGAASGAVIGGLIGMAFPDHAWEPAQAPSLVVVPHGAGGARVALGLRF